MKIKLFLSASLAALGLWLAAAFLHTVDVASYQGESSQQLAEVEHLEEKSLPLNETEKADSEALALSQ